MILQVCFSIKLENTSKNEKGTGGTKTGPVAAITTSVAQRTARHQAGLSGAAMAQQRGAATGARRKPVGPPRGSEWPGHGVNRPA